MLSKSNIHIAYDLFKEYLSFEGFFHRNFMSSVLKIKVVMYVKMVSEAVSRPETF